MFIYGIGVGSVVLTFIIIVY